VISAPHGRWHERDEIEHPLCASDFVGQSPRAIHGLSDVGDPSVAPAAYLVAEDPKPARAAGSDRAFGDHAALLAVGVTDWRLLDDEPRRRDTDFERRVIQGARRSPRGARRRRLEHAPVESHELATSSERQPVQVDRSPFRTCRGPEAWACAGRRHVATIAVRLSFDNDLGGVRSAA
jgi:hypothetical protein